MNKIKLILGCLLVAISPTLFAQSLELMDGTIMHNEKVRDCITVNVDPDPETLEDAWEDYLDENYDFKLKAKGLFNSQDLYYAEEVTIGKISPKAMNFYTHIVENGEGSKMKVFASFGYDIYVNQATGAEYKAMKAIVEDFLKGYLPTYYNEQIIETKEKRVFKWN